MRRLTDRKAAGVARGARAARVAGKVPTSASAAAPALPALSAHEGAMLARAVELAEKGLFGAPPNPRVGCVICQGREVAGEGWHARAGQAHAEVAALRAAGARARGATVFVSLEPCAHFGKTPPCAQALIDAGVARVVAALPDPDARVAGAGMAALRAAGICAEFAPADCAPVRAAHLLNAGYFSRLVRRRPWVRLKVAATLDGKTALGNGLSQWITGEEARQDAHRLRAASCAIVTGIGTARQDDPRLTARGVGAARQPLRVLVDSGCRAPRSLRLFADDNVLVAAAVCPPAGFVAPVVTLPDARGKVDLGALMGELAARDAGEVVVEAGRRLNGALLAAGLADEIVLYLAGRVFGDSGRDMFALPAPDTPDAAPVFERAGLREFANGDVRITYRAADALAGCLPCAG